MSLFSRRQLANYVADQLLAGRSAVIDELAAYLVETRRIKEADTLVMSIESALLMRGVLVAEVSSTRPLSDSTRTLIASKLRQAFQTQTLHLRERTDPSLLGGILVRTADHEMDGTLRHALNQLKALKV
ncbi:MAG: F0F1 ATP synthase subunit delta [Myxococcales bacterium]|jgi:F-type H+-transporting ATPase subunit delta|nr:F0F1 ATP synthase subunit delta [Myxococcales bacterium]